MEGTSEQTRDTLVVGASAGGLEALKRLVSVFPADLAGSVFVAFHLQATGPRLLAEILQRSSALEVTFASNGMAIRHGCIYIAPPDRHLVLSDDHMSLVHGPRENRARPAIDPLFRSAAVHRRARVMGVVLSGMLDDGAAGLLAIKRCGGVALVQEPGDAGEPSMPLSAARALGGLLDGAMPAEALGRRIVHLIGTPAPEPPSVPQEIQLEDATSHSTGCSENALDSITHRTPLTCPECGGPLGRLAQEQGDSGERVRFRCYTGHAYTVRTLLADQSERLERALWAAIRSMQERSSTLAALARSSRDRGQERSAGLLVQEATQMNEHAETLRALVLEQRSRTADA